MSDQNAAAATAEKATKGKGKKAAAEAPVEKVKTPGIGDKAKELIRAGKTNDEVLAGVKGAFPESNCSMASINWYRNNLRQAGESVPTSRELRPKVEKPVKEKAPAKPRGKKAQAAASEAAQAEAEGASHLQ